MRDIGAYVIGAPAWWDADKIPAKVQNTVAYCLDMVNPRTWDETQKNGLLLYGPPGTGKTSAAVAILYAWGRCGLVTQFQDFGELMVSVRSSWRKDASRTNEQILDAMKAPKILCLDDVGKRNAPEDQETLSVLFNARINLGRPTICTTNFNMASTEGRAQFTSACDSRVLERFTGCDVAVVGENLRRGK